VISASPRVSSAPFVLSPYPSPSHSPAAIAITFLSAAPYSQPATSSFVYTRSRGFENSCWTASARPAFRDAATTEVGMSRLTSSAWLGPTNTTGSGSPSASVSTSPGRFSEPSSSPFVAHTGMPLPPADRTRPATSRSAWDGTTNSVTSAPRSASSTCR
jgi:hypothetical protein